MLRESHRLRRRGGTRLGHRRPPDRDHQRWDETPGEPDPEKPDPEKPDTDKPDAEKPDAEKTDANKSGSLPKTGATIGLALVAGTAMVGGGAFLRRRFK